MYTIEYGEYGVYRFKEIWEMIEETNDDKKVFTCAKNAIVNSRQCQV